MPKNWSAEDNVTEVAEDVFFIEGPAVNWTILKRGNEFTLIDIAVSPATRASPRHRAIALAAGLVAGHFVDAAYRIAAHFFIKWVAMFLQRIHWITSAQ